MKKHDSRTRFTFLLILGMQAICLAMTDGMRAYQHHTLGQTQLALRWYTRALASAEAGDDVNAQAKYALNIATILIAQDRTSDAEVFLDRAKTLYEHTKNTHGSALTLLQQAKISAAGSKFDEAERLLLESRDMLQKVNDKRGGALVANELGVIYLKKGNNKEARGLFNQAYQVNKKKSPIAAAANINNLGKAHMAMGELGVAMQFFNQAIEIDQKVENVKGKSSTLLHMAFCCQKQGDCSNSRYFLGRAKTLGIPAGLQNEYQSIIAGCPE